MCSWIEEILRPTCYRDASLPLRIQLSPRKTLRPCCCDQIPKTDPIRPSGGGVAIQTQVDNKYHVMGQMNNRHLAIKWKRGIKSLPDCMTI